MRPAAPGIVARVARACFGDAPTSVALAAAGLLGLALFVRIFGMGYLLGTSAYWSYPHGDAAMTLTGWNYFIHDGWHWPLGTTKLTNAPEGVNILFFDAIPGVAIPAKLLVPLLGTHWHPFGIWHAAVYVLQAIFAVLLVRRLGVRSLSGAVAAALLCLTMSAFLLRFYHEDLNGQFVLLWALLNYARSVRSTSTPSLIAGWVACLGASLLIQPYLTAMVGAVAVAAHVRLAATDRVRALQSAACAVASLAVTWWTVGYVFAVPTDGEVLGFGVTSMNLLSPWVPLHSALVPGAPSMVVQDGTGFQWDGQNFLGVGVLALLLLAVTAGARTSLALVKGHKALAFVLVTLAVYALGQHWYFGTRAVVDLAFVDSLPNALRTFRATGRFFWTVGYAIAIGSLVVVTRRFGRRGVAAALALATLQLVDSSACWTVISGATAEPWERYADWTTWQDVLPAYRKLAMYPSWYCWGATDPGEPTLRAERDIEFLAAVNGLQTNHARTGRVVTDCSRGVVDPGTLGQSGLAPDTLYVFLRPAYDDDAIARIGKDHCAEFGAGWLCAEGRPTVPSAMTFGLQAER